MKKKLLFGLVPLLFFAALWRVNWQRLHPSPTPEDQRIRDLLMAADQVKVQVENREVTGASGSIVYTFRTFVKLVTRDEMSPIASYVNLLDGTDQTSSAGAMPIVYFDFYRQGKYQGALAISYGNTAYNVFAGKDSILGKELHPTTVKRLREFVTHDSHILKVIEDKKRATVQY